MTEAQMARPKPAERPRRGWRVNLALGVRSTIAPAIVYIPIGYALGPQGLNVLSSGVLGHLGVVVSLALATLGVFVGLGIDLRSRLDWRLFAVASLEAVVTAAVVAGAIGWLVLRWGMSLANTVAPVPLVLGLCAAASAAVARHAPRDPAETRMARIAELDDVVLVALGGAALAWQARASAGAAGSLRFSLLVAGLIAVAGWLLFERARNAAERAVFVIGALALLAGAAAYLALSPLLLGMLAGVAWMWLPGRADQIIKDDVVRLQHPLVVLLLIMAGATIQATAMAVWLLAPFLIFRMSGKLMGGWAAGRLFGNLTPVDLVAHLLPSGLLGVALAIQFDQLAGGPVGPAVVTAVAVGSMVYEIVAVLALAGGAEPA